MLPGGWLSCAMPPFPFADPGAPPTRLYFHVAQATPRSSRRPSTSSRYSSTASELLPSSPSVSLSHEGAGDTGHQPGQAACFNVCTISTSIHLSQRLLAKPTPPCVVFPPELRVEGTSPAYAAN